MTMFFGTLLHVTASNVVVAAALACLAWSAGRWLRRPALSHALWLLVLLKLVTPPIVPVTLWRTTASAEAKAPVTSPPPRIALAPARMDVPGADVGALESDVSDVGIPDAENTPPPVGAASGAAPRVAAPPDVGVIPDEPPPARFFEPGLNDVGHVSNVPATSRLETAGLAVAVLWLAGSLFWLVVAVRRLVSFQRLLRHAESAPADIRAVAQELAKALAVRCPPVVALPGAITPLVWCLFGKPRLVIPTALLGQLDAEQWRTLLAHELAHLRRRDHWVRWLEFVVLGVYWWCPLAWWARRQLQQAEEECCDAWVVWALPEAVRTYAAALVDTVDFLAGARPVLPVTASGLGHLHLLKRRLTMILRGTTPRTMSGGGLAVVLGLGAALLPLMPTWAQEPPAEQPELPAAKVQRGGDTQDPKRRPTPAPTEPRNNPDGRDDLERELNRMQREMAELQEQIAHKQRRIAELARRLGTPRPDEAATPRAEPPRPVPMLPTPPRQPQPPQPAQPRYIAPGQAHPPGAMPMNPAPGNLERRIESLERKLDAVLRQLEVRYPPPTATTPGYAYPPGRAPQPRPPAQPQPPAPTRPVPADEAPPRVPPPPPERRPGADNVPAQPPAPAPAGPVGLPPTAVVPAP